ncbi:hypothetical protein BH24DEI2_BH24DEI2_15450 [soil metagenome]
MAAKQKPKQKQSQQAQTDVYNSVPTGRLILAWGVVGIPFIYGVSQVFIKALALFQ